jgi:hypothetical protein
MASGPARDVDLQLARGRPTLPAERFLTPAEALGEDALAKLGRLEQQVLQLDLLVANAEFVEKSMRILDSGQCDAVSKFARDHPGERWAVYTVSSSDDIHLCIDVPPGLHGRQLDEAIMYPELHMRLVSWWLSHAWRYIDLANTAINSLYSWNITTAALASRALFEEVGCLLYEGEELSKRWLEAKFAPADNNREMTVRTLLANKLLEFSFGQRGLEFISEGEELPQAKNVMTYIQKLTKRTKIPEIDMYYAYLSNVAHPAFTGRMIYSSSFVEHESGALSLRRLSLRPATFMTRGEDFWDLIPAMAADATFMVGSTGQDLLAQSLQMVDDFGLTTRSGLLTLHPYWRKLMPGRRSSDACPCGCGKWRAAKHQWGQPAPEICLTA